MMANEVKLPRLGQGMEAGTIVKWLKSEGEPVEKGEPLYELDTDKVTQEVESDFAGTLLKIAIEEGEVPVGKTIGVIGEQGEEFAIAEPEAAEKVTEKEAPQAPPAPESEPEKPAASRDGRVKASPLARRIARERGIDLATVRGTGPEGRIVAEDVERAEAAPAAAPPAPVAVGEAERRELTSIRRTIAKRLTEAWTIPVFNLQASVDMTRANALVAPAAGSRAEGDRDRPPREGRARPPSWSTARSTRNGRTRRSSSIRARTSASPSRLRRGWSCR